MAELNADLCRRLGMDEIDQPLPCSLMHGSIETWTTGGDPPLRTDASHFGIDESGAALRTFGIMREMPIGGATVYRFVLRHRRDDDPVSERHPA